MYTAIVSSWRHREKRRKRRRITSVHSIDKYLLLSASIVGILYIYNFHHLNKTSGKKNQIASAERTGSIVLGILNIGTEEDKCTSSPLSILNSISEQAEVGTQILKGFWTLNA